METGKKSINYVKLEIAVSITDIIIDSQQMARLHLSSRNKITHRKRFSTVLYMKLDSLCLSLDSYLRHILISFFLSAEEAGRVLLQHLQFYDVFYIGGSARGIVRRGRGGY